MKRISVDVGMPQRLSDLGISERDIPEMADAAIEAFYSRMREKNPRAVTREDVVQLYTAAL